MSDVEVKDFDVNKFRNQSAFVVGYTGEVGKQVAKLLLTHKIFGRVVLIGRRVVDYKEEIYKDAEQRVVDFDKLEVSKDVFKDLSVGFCCLGTTWKIAGGAEGYIKIEHDYVLNVARLAKESGCKDFSIVSGGYVNKDSRFSVMIRTKGMTEYDCGQVGFEHFTAVRPAMLVSDRNSTRFVEKFTLGLMKPIHLVKPRWGAIPTETVAAAMIYTLWRPARPNVETVDNQTLHRMGDEFNKNFPLQLQ